MKCCSALPFIDCPFLVCVIEYFPCKLVMQCTATLRHLYTTISPQIIMLIWLLASTQLSAQVDYKAYYILSEPCACSF